MLKLFGLVCLTILSLSHNDKIFHKSSQYTLEMEQESHSSDLTHFEQINKEIFHKRVISVNYTKETINGQQIKYYLTDTGDWHLDSCTIIGKEGVGLIGLYYEMTDQRRRRRRMNPYQATNGLGTWENGIVPYVIEHQTLNMVNWNKAVAHYAAVSPIRLVDYTNKARPKFYIRVFQGSGCYGTLGRIHEYFTTQPNYQGNSLSLGTNCDRAVTTIVHEIGHNIGFMHTQMRSDRDNYVTVNYNNIIQSYWDQYDKSDLPICGQYDCRSVMHYFDTAFGNGNGKTLVSKNPTTCTIQRSESDPLSYWDKYCLCQLYPPNSNGNPSSFCNGGGGDPTQYPTMKPTLKPTSGNTGNPTKKPSIRPSFSPTTKQPTVNSNNFCLRGIGNTGTNVFINGNYIRQQYNDGNGNVYYKNKRISCNLNVYIYKYTRYFYLKESNTFTQRTVWAINRELNAGAPIGICYETDLFNCDQKWVFNGVTDSNLRLRPGECPTLTCNTLTVSNTNSNCDGDYTEVSTNVYSKTGYYLIYNDFYEQYRCVTTNQKSYINPCDLYDGISASNLGAFPDLTNYETIVRWSGDEGSVAKLKCTETTTTTPAPTYGNRNTIECNQAITGTLNANWYTLYDFTAETKYYAYMFYGCYDDTTSAMSMEFSTQNLENELPSQDYSDHYCSSTNWKPVKVLWESTSNYLNGNKYTLKIKNIGSGTGNYRIAMWCYTNQNDALSFGKNNGVTVPIYSFKNYGAVQWGIFFGLLALCIIVNVLIVYFVVKKIVKKKSVEFDDKAKTEETQMTQQVQQQNIQYADEDDDGPKLTNF